LINLNFDLLIFTGNGESMERFILIALIWMFMATSVYAHPGNTDSSGKHSCWTNCSKWGLNYGEYHGHIDSSTSDTSSSSFESYDTYDDSIYIYESEGDDLEAEGYSRGYTDGESGKEYDDYDYYFYRGNSPAAYERYLLGYELGYESGKIALEEKIRAKKIADEEEGRKAGEDQAVKDFLNNIDQPLENEKENIEWNKGFKEAYKNVQSELAEVVDVAFHDGYTLVELDKTYNSYKLNVYKSNYEKGLEQHKKEIFEEGYNDAYELNTYSIDIENLNERLQTEYKKGFDSNREVETIRKEAIEAGQSILPVDIPKEYEQNKLMLQAYKTAFQEGRNKLYKLIALATTGVGTFLISILLFYRKKRKR